MEVWARKNYGPYTAPCQRRQHHDRSRSKAPDRGNLHPTAMVVGIVLLLILLGIGYYVSPTLGLAA